MLKRLVRTLVGPGREFRQTAPASENPLELVDRAVAAQRNGERVLARTLYLQTLQIDPKCADALHLLGVLEYQERHHDDAIDLIEDAIALQPAQPEYLMNCGLAYLARGEIDAAIDRLRRALRLRPGYAKAHANLLFALNYVAGADADMVFAEHCAWGAACAARIPTRSPRRDNDPGRRLRVGYLSPDYRVHAVAPFIEPAFAHHTQTEVEVFSYDNSPASDAVTARMKGYRVTWRDIRNLGDEQAADMIEHDRIDILVDLAGHNVGGRLEVFARRPAPLQASFLGYLNTSGLEAINYRITDAVADPAGQSDRHHVEKLWRLPGSFWCFHPPDDAPEVSLLPARVAGHITFGSFNNFAKLNQTVTDAWIEILKRCKDAHLVVAGIPEGLALTAFIRRFVSAGIDPARLELSGRVNLDAYRLLHRRVDIALDAFPYAGGSTTCEALWMGVPVVSLLGGYGFAGSGASILNAAGLGDFVADNVEHYVELAEKLGRDQRRLAELRGGMREHLCKSELTNGPQFTARLEAAYREMWGRWCAAAGS